MSKIMILPTKDNIDDVAKYSDAILVGVENLSVNMPDVYTIAEVKDLCNKYQEKDIFVIVNKNMHTKDLEDLKETLKELDVLGLKGIFFYDISVVQYKIELNLKTPLVWSQEHLTTNYATMNYWHPKGIDYAYVSSEITLDEIKTIKKETPINLIVPLFGYLPMFVSKRNLVNNYKEYFNIEDDSKTYEIEKEDRKYPIDNNNLGTVVYSSSILNGLEEFEQLENIGISYITLNSYRIPRDKFVEVAKLFYMREYKSNKIDNMFSNTDKGFLYKETIYRVKKNEKK